MKEQDLTVFEYRRQKEVLYHEALLTERTTGGFEKGSIWTDIAGYVDFSIYRPSGWDGKEVLPAAFNLHGGGCVLGMYELDGPYCRRLAENCHMAIVNIDYPLAPEFKYPLPILAANQAIRAILKQAPAYKFDAENVQILGHSAGGYYALALCLLDLKEKKDQQIGYRGLIVDYAPLRQFVDPWVRQSKDPETAIRPSRAAQCLQWYLESPAQADEWLASPVLADPTGLPPVLVISAELDSLLGEEEEFANNARRAGVDVEHVIYSGCQHGFTHTVYQAASSKEAEQAWDKMAEFLSTHQKPSCMFASAEAAVCESSRTAA